MDQECAGKAEDLARTFFKAEEIWLPILENLVSPPGCPYLQTAMPTPPQKNSPTPKPEDIEAEFSRLFWEARREYMQLKGKASAASPATKDALAFAETQGWEWAKSLIEVGLIDLVNDSDKALEILTEVQSDVPERWQGLLHHIRGVACYVRGEYDEAIKAYRMAIDDPHFDKPGIAWNNIGLVFEANGEHDHAIKAYREALADPGFEQCEGTWNSLGLALMAKGEHDEAMKVFSKALADPNNAMRGYTWNLLGNLYYAKGEHDNAIEAYREALADANYEEPGIAWYNLGNVLAVKGEYDDAIIAYQAALGDPNYRTAGIVWNNFGLVLATKGEHERAIKAYSNALADPKYNTPAKAWANLAQMYADTGNPREAEAAFEKALGSPDPKGSDHARARLALQILKAKIGPESLSPHDRAMMATSGKNSATSSIEEGIIAAIDKAGVTQYETYIKQPDSMRGDTLSILRGWSSAVTLLEGSERRWRGGGYFLKWRGYGIVIDPGFDFLRNFHDASYHGREISAVVVSHNHPDHNSDLKDIDDLRYELYKRLAADKGPGSQPYVLLWDEDTSKATRFGTDKPQHRHPPIVMGSGFPQPFDLGTHAAEVPVRIIPFNVNHSGDVPSAMGMMVELLDDKGNALVRIGYTADTAYFKELHQQLANCDVLIAHISQPDRDELTDASKLKEVHLGYRGTAKLLKECQPKLALIGEFWAGYTDLRIPLVKGLRQLSGLKDVLPAGLAMHLRLPSLDIECTECSKPTPFAQIKVAPPTDKFGSLAYLCPSCMIE